MTGMDAYIDMRPKLLAGLSVEKHVVETHDGFQLTLFRLGRKGKPCNGLPPVLMMHGLLQTAMVRDPAHLVAL